MTCALAKDDQMWEKSVATVKARSLGFTLPAVRCPSAARPPVRCPAAACLPVRSLVAALLPIRCPAT
eukprot:4349571-Pyramimonas_sp.AAC.1